MNRVVLWMLKAFRWGIVSLYALGVATPLVLIAIGIIRDKPGAVAQGAISLAMMPVMVLFSLPLLMFLNSIIEDLQGKPKSR